MKGKCYPSGSMSFSPSIVLSLRLLSLFKVRRLHLLYTIFIIARIIALHIYRCRAYSSHPDSAAATPPFPCDTLIPLVQLERRVLWITERISTSEVSQRHGLDLPRDDIHQQRSSRLSYLMNASERTVAVDYNSYSILQPSPALPRPRLMPRIMAQNRRVESENGDESEEGELETLEDEDTDLDMTESEMRFLDEYGDGEGGSDGTWSTKPEPARRSIVTFTVLKRFVEEKDALARYHPLSCADQALLDESSDSDSSPYSEDNPPSAQPRHHTDTSDADLAAEIWLNTFADEKYDDLTMKDGTRLRQVQATYEQRLMALETAIPATDDELWLGDQRWRKVRYVLQRDEKAKILQKDLREWGWGCNGVARERIWGVRWLDM